MFRIKGRVVLSVVLLGFAANAMAIDAQGVMACVQSKQLERWEGVNSYAVVKTVMGHGVAEYYERIDVEDKKGQVQTVFKRVTPDDYQTITVDGQTISAEEFYEQYADALDMTGGAMGDEIESQMTERGLPSGLLRGTGSDPWATMDPRTMLGGGAQMMREAAAHKRHQRLNPTDHAEGVNQMADFAASARYIGQEKVEGRRAYRLQAEGLDQVQEANGERFEMNTFDMWIDKEWCVPVKQEVRGVAIAEGAEPRPFVLKMTYGNYRQVPKSNMFEPYLQTTSMQGVMSPAQEAELADAQKQLAEVEKQFATMNAQQRKMMEDMMGPQLAAMRQMANGGGFNLEIVVNEIAVNGAPNQLPVAGGSMASGMFSAGQNSAMAAAPQSAPAVPQGISAAQQACLQQQADAAREAEEKAKKKRGFGRLLGAVSRTASRVGGGVSQGVQSALGKAYDTNATVRDLGIAAEELGLTPEQAENCRDVQ